MYNFIYITSILGFVGDQVDLLDKEYEVQRNHNGLVKTYNVDNTMDVSFPAEDKIHSKQSEDTVPHEVDLPLFNISNDGEDVLASGNKSAESLLYHSAESAQYHSAESVQMENEQLDIDMKDTQNNIFNVGVQITLNDKAITPEDFDNDVSSSSEALNTEIDTKDNIECDDIILNGNNSDPAVTVTTLCEALLKENGVNACKISELSSEESDAVVMKTFMISSDEYDATVTTMLEISPSNTNDTTSTKTCDMPHDEHSAMKTFEISSPKYDAIITTTVEELPPPGTSDDGKQIDILSHNVDGGVKTDQDGGTNEINFQISCSDGDLQTMSSNDFVDHEHISSTDVVVEDEKCGKDISPTSVLSHDNDVSIDKTLGVGTDEDDLETTEVSYETDASNITSLSGSLSPIKKSHEELSYYSNFDDMKTSNEDDADQMTFLVSTDIHPEIHHTSDEQDIENDGANTKTYDILSQEEGITTDISNDQLIDCSLVDIHILPSSQTSFGYSDYAIDETSSFETDITVQDVHNVVAEPDDNIVIDNRNKSNDMTVEAISSSECIDTTEIQCDISPDESSGSVDATFDEQKYGGISKAVIESSSQISAASSNKSFEILSFDSDSNVVNRSDDKIFSDIDASHKIDIDMKKLDELQEPETNVVNICDESDVATGDLQKISSFSSIEADVIIDKTFDALSNDTAKTPDSTIESDISEKTYDILSIDTKISNEVVTTNEEDVNSSKDIEILHNGSEESILKISEFSQHEAGAIIDKTFEDLSNEGGKVAPEACVISMKSDISEKAYDILSIDAKIADTVDVASDEIIPNDANGSMQRIGDFSDHEAGAIMEKTFEDLSNETAHVIPDVSVSSLRSDTSEKAYDILSVDTQIPDRIDVPTDVTPDEYFAHLSIEADVTVQQPTVFLTDEADMNSNEGIEILPTETNESVLKIDDFSDHEAGAIIDKMLHVISTEADDVSKNSVLPNESNTDSEITYHIVSIENGNPDEDDDFTNAVKKFDKSGVNTHETFEHLTHEDNINTNKSIEILLHEEDNGINNLSDVSSDVSSDEVIETLEGICHEPDHNVSEIFVPPKELDIPEKTYDIYSFDDGIPKDNNITTVLKTTGEANVPTDDTFEHLATHATNGIDNKNNETISHKQNDDVNKIIDVPIPEVKIPNITNISNNNDKSDEFVDIAGDQISTSVDSLITKGIDITYNGKTLAEIADIYDKANPIEGNIIDYKNIHSNVQQEINGYHREGSQFEVIEGRSFGILNSRTVDTDVNQKITPPVDILIDKTPDNNDFINVDVENTHLKTEQPKIKTNDKTNSIPINPSNDETIKNIKNGINGHGIESTVMSDKQANTSVEKTIVEIIKKKKEKNVKKIHISCLEDYDVIDHDEVNSVVIPGSCIQPRFSFATLSFKIKKAFSPSAEWKNKQEFFNKPPVTNGSKKLSINVEEQKTNDGEEIQVGLS